MWICFVMSFNTFIISLVKSFFCDLRNERLFRNKGVYLDNMVEFVKRNYLNWLNPRQCFGLVEE